MIPKFKKGDKIKIRVSADSQFRGRTGIIEKEPNEIANMAYIVKIESPGFTPTCQVYEKDLEAVGK